MGRFRDVQAFVREVNRVETMDDLGGLVGDMAGLMGFRYFALGHHVNVFSNENIQLGNYPQSWVEIVFARGYMSTDPALVACQRANVGFRWSELPNLITLTPLHKQILADARAAGFGEGFTVPIHVPGECAGSCHFVTDSKHTVRESSMPPAQYVGAFAFEAARRMVRAKVANKPVKEGSQIPSLSARQLDCIVLAARGKSDWDAGQLLGISNQTVHQHLETAKKRYGVATRAQLIVRTLFDSQLVFKDVMH